MIFLAIAMVVGAIVLAALGVYRLWFRRPTMKRTQRLVAGSWNWEKRWTDRLWEMFGVAHADRICQYAGRPFGLTGIVLLQWQFLFGVVCAVVFLKLGIIFGFAVGCVGWYVPRFLMGLRADQRRSQIALELPAFLDVWGLLVASGEGLETALVEICKRHPNWMLTAEIGRVRNRVSSSGLFGEALIEEAKVTGSTDFVTVAEQVSHLDRGGGVPSRELARIAEQMREQRVTELTQAAGAMSLVGILPKLFATFLSLAPVLAAIVLTVVKQV